MSNEPEFNVEKQVDHSYIHNLIRLAEIADLKLDIKHRKVLAEINDFNIEGRYSDLVRPPVSYKDAKSYLQGAKGTFEWLKKRL